jgi:hypothetical protein
MESVDLGVWWLVAQFVIADVCCGNKFLERCSMDGYRDGSRCFACEMWRAFFCRLMCLLESCGE